MRFVDAFPAAEKQSPRAQSLSFSVADVELGGTRMRAIFARPPSRLGWSIDVPAHASLSGSVGLLPAAWFGPGDGVVFQIGISSGSERHELYSRHVNPRRRNDREWIPFDVALDRFAGTHVQLHLDTAPSLSDRPLDTRNDLAVWGEPVLVVHSR